MSGEPDVLAWVEEQLGEARAAAARAYDRQDALEELRGLLYGFAAERRAVTLTPAEMWRAPASSEQRAQLGALIDRILPADESAKLRAA